jgi:hypothetical protein
MARAAIDVDVSTIGSLARNLTNLYTDFDDVPETGDDINGAIGSDVVKQAVTDFATNWKTRRGRLLESVGAVRDSAKKAEDAFSKVDLELANQILGKGK